MNDFVERYVFGYAIDEDGDWIPDPDDIFEAPTDPDQPRQLTHMELAKAHAAARIAEIMELFGMTS